jgi:hypothetical protein
MTSLEKTPLQSKKFIAYILSNLGSKALLFWMINQDVSDFVLITTVTAASFIDIGYILGQAALDKYVRIASIDKEEISV